MTRYKLTIEYHGGPFIGWQRQNNGPSVQAALRTAALKFDPGASEVYGAGRTDSGVHAYGQVAHIDLAKPFEPDKVRDALNYHLKPLPISILSAVKVDEQFHARFGATQRGYIYRIITRRPPLALDHGLAWRVARTLDSDGMHEAAQYLLGEHDFTTFRDRQCQADSPVKSIDKACVDTFGDDEVIITVQAISFLHRQVRSIVGSLVEVGLGKWSPADFKSALQAVDRKRCGPVAPPDGLYLDFVRY